LHATAFKSEYINLFINIINECKKNNDPFIDVQFWNSVRHYKTKQINVRKVISIKGMPGKNGYSLKHKPYWAIKDINHEKLISWVGDDSAAYIEVMKNYVV
jgi:hypothetical protein